MSVVARRSLALWLAGGAALLLLLLTRLPPAPPLHRHPPPHPQHAAPSASSAASASQDKQLVWQVGGRAVVAGAAAVTAVAAAPRAPGTAPPPPHPQHPASSAASTPHDKLLGLPSIAPPANVTSSPRALPADIPAEKPADKSPDNQKQKVLLVKDLYVAGHAVAHPERCPALGAGVRALVLVTSAPTHRAARDAVRLTWGHFALRSDVAMAFIIGLPPDHLLPALVAEDALYGDLVMGNWVDSYSNLTLKTLSILEWADTYCPRASAVLKTDDDVFVNVPKLLQYLNVPARANATPTIYGKVLKKALPQRTRRSKYFLSHGQFPGRVLPDFATGPAYAVTRGAVRPLLAAARAQRYVRLEDVFVGIIARAAGVKLQHAKEFYNKKISPHPCAVQRGISIHMVRYHEQFDLWKKLLDNTTKCS